MGEKCAICGKHERRKLSTVCEECAPAYAEWVRSVIRHWPVTPRPELDRLLEAARNHVMTPDEIRAQRKSWVIGEMMLEHLDMTREQAEAIYNKVTY